MLTIPSHLLREARADPEAVRLPDAIRERLHGAGLAESDLIAALGALVRSSDRIEVRGSQSIDLHTAVPWAAMERGGRVALLSSEAVARTLAEALGVLGERAEPGSYTLAVHRSTGPVLEIDLACEEAQRDWVMTDGQARVPLRPLEVWVLLNAVVQVATASEEAADLS